MPFESFESTMSAALQRNNVLRIASRRTGVFRVPRITLCTFVLLFLISGVCVPVAFGVKWWQQKVLTGDGYNYLVIKATFGDNLNLCTLEGAGALTMCITPPNGTTITSHDNFEISYVQVESSSEQVGSQYCIRVDICDIWAAQACSPTVKVQLHFDKVIGRTETLMYELLYSGRHLELNSNGVNLVTVDSCTIATVIDVTGSLCTGLTFYIEDSSSNFRCVGAWQENIVGCGVRYCSKSSYGLTDTDRTNDETKSVAIYGVTDPKTTPYNPNTTPPPVTRSQTASSSASGPRGRGTNTTTAPANAPTTTSGVDRIGSVSTIFTIATAVGFCCMFFE